MEKFKTKDLKLASFLYASQLKLTGYTKLSSSVFFEFSPLLSANILYRDYIDGNALVDPRDLLYRYNDLKSIIFNLSHFEEDTDE